MESSQHSSAVVPTAVYGPGRRAILQQSQRNSVTHKLACFKSWRRRWRGFPSINSSLAAGRWKLEFFLRSN